MTQLLQNDNNAEVMFVLKRDQMLIATKITVLVIISQERRQKVRKGKENKADSHLLVLEVLLLHFQ